MNGRDHQAHRDELAGYLLGALEPGEAAALEQHLAGCDECRADLEWLRPAVLTLPAAVEPAEPPAGLRARIMGEIEADAKPERAANRFGWKRRSPFLRPLAGLAVIALLAAAVAGYAIRDGGEDGSDAITVAVGKPPAVTAEMISQDDSGTLRLENLHQLPADEVLQAWVQRGEQVESAKTLFVPNADGTATAVIADMEGVDAVMVTAEPRGGSDQPTSEPIVAVELPS